MAQHDPVGDLNYVCLLAIEDQPDEDLAGALERLFSYRLKAKPVSDSLRDKLSGKPFHVHLNRPPSEYLLDTIDRLQDWVWHHVDGKERHRERIESLPKIASPPKFNMEQLLGLKNVVADWVQRNPIDFVLLADAIKVEMSLIKLEKIPTSRDSAENPPDTIHVERTKQAKLDALPKTQREAWAALQYVVSKIGKSTYANAWGHLYDNRSELGTELPGYTLPSKKTFCDYLTKAAKGLGESRNQPRAGRVGRNIVDQSGLSTLE